MAGTAHPDSDVARRLSSKLIERNCLFLLLALFILLSILIASILYLPEKDLADATTNDIWIEYYSKGIYSVPFSEWTHGNTQSVVVLHDGVFTVVNEKGPGHVMMMLPFHMMGIEFLFGPVMMAFAVFSTYMLGKRLLDWRVGFLAAILVLTNVTVLVMWYRYYWTDASTMHTLVLSVWLLVEANYWYNGKRLDARKEQNATTKQRLLAAGLGILSGLAFGASVSTRYATALILVALIFYLAAFYLIRSWPHLRKRQVLKALKETAGFWLILAVFFLGLMCVLIPLMNYNTEYFGGPFRSGYDATPLMQFNTTRGLTPRNTSGTWSSGFMSSLSTTLGNFGAILPTLIMRVPALLIVPVGIWVLRKKPMILTFLLLWIVINLATYLSLGWMDMYANIPPGVMHEPRYFMPSLPPMVIIGGAGIMGFARWAVQKTSTKGIDSEAKKVRKAFVACTIVGILALAGLVPAANYFSTLQYGGALQPRPGGPPPPQQPVTVTTDQLVNNPAMYNGSIVRVANAVVLSVNGIVVRILSPGSIHANGVAVHLDFFPPGQLPNVQVGNSVEVTGHFVVRLLPNQQMDTFIGVRYNTPDLFRILP
jgi:hypothetical protein